MPKIRKTSLSQSSGETTDLAYGEMFAVAVTKTVTVSAKNVAYEIDGSFTAGELNLISFPDDHYLLASLTGKYLAVWALSLICNTAAQGFDGGIMVNGAVLSPLKGVCRTFAATSGYSFGLSSTAIISLSANDQVSLYVINRSGANDIIMTFGSLTLLRIDGT